MIHYIKVEEAKANVVLQETALPMPQFAVSGVTVKKQISQMEMPMPENVEAQGIAQAGHPTVANGAIVKSQVAVEDQGVGWAFT